MAKIKVSASTVSRALTAGGMTRSTVLIKGRSQQSAGFQVTSWQQDSHAEVAWVNGRFSVRDRSAVELAKAEAILTAKGYVVVVVTDEHKTTLTVHKYVPDEES